MGLRITKFNKAAFFKPFSGQTLKIRFVKFVNFKFVKFGNFSLVDWALTLGQTK